MIEKWKSYSFMESILIHVRKFRLLSLLPKIAFKEFLKILMTKFWSFLMKNLFSLGSKNQSQWILTFVHPSHGLVTFQPLTELLFCLTKSKKKFAKNIFGKNKVSFCLINCHLVSVVKNKFEEYAMNTNFVRFIVFR